MNASADEIREWKPVVQILEIRLVQAQQTNNRAEQDAQVPFLGYRLTLSDGTRFIQAVLAAPHSWFVDEVAVIDNSICRVNCVIVNSRNSRIPIVIDIEVLQFYADKVGNPEQAPQDVATGNQEDARLASPHTIDDTDLESALAVSNLIIDSESLDVSPAPQESPAVSEGIDRGNIPIDLGPSPRYHEAYYIRDDMIQLKVEDTMFRIPCFLLTTHSTVLRDLIRRRDEENSNSAIHLSSVTADGFANLLHVLDPLQLRSAQHFDVAQWTSALSASTELGFRNVRQQAVDELAKLASPVDKIMLARSYDLEPWLSDAYVSLCKREEPLTLEEARRIPLEDVVKLGQIRHQVRQGAFQWTEESRLQVLSTLDGRPQEAPSPDPDDSVPASLEHVLLNDQPPEQLQTPKDGDLPLGSVIQEVAHGLDVFARPEASAYLRGKQLILSAVDRSGKSMRTIESICDLIVSSGLVNWSPLSTSVGNRCASLLEDAADHLGQRLLDVSRVSPEGKAFTVKAGLSRYIEVLCSEQCKYNFDNINLAVSQAGFMSVLCAKGLLEVGHICRWWACATTRNQYTSLQHTYETKKGHIFFSAVGQWIDVPGTESAVDKVVQFWSNKSNFADWGAVQPEIQGLLALKGRNWQRTSF